MRKALGSFESPYIISLLRLMETQSKPTIIKWCVGYAEANILPLFENAYPSDTRQRIALSSAMGWLTGDVKYFDARHSISAAYDALSAIQDISAAQAAVRAINQASLTIHVPAHGLGLAFYGTLAIAYARASIDADDVLFVQIAAEECGKMEVALREINIVNEGNPAKIDLRIWPSWKIG